MILVSFGAAAKWADLKHCCDAEVGIDVDPSRDTRTKELLHTESDLRFTADPNRNKNLILSDCGEASRCVNLPAYVNPMLLIPPAFHNTRSASMYANVSLTQSVSLVPQPSSTDLVKLYGLCSNCLLNVTTARDQLKPADTHARSVVLSMSMTYARSTAGIFY